MNKLMYNIVVKLCIIIYPSVNVKDYINPFFKLMNRLIKTQGLIKTVKYLKQCRLHCTRYICGQPLLYNKLKIGVDPDGWPKSLRFLQDLAHGSLEERKFLMTLLCLSRTLVPNPKERKLIKPDYESITKQGIVKKHIPTGFITEFVRKYKLKINKDNPYESDLLKFDKEKIYLSNKAGPDGKATLTSLNSLSKYSYTDLQLLFNLTDQSGIDYITQSYKFAFYKVDKSKIKVNGKLSFIYDPECKLRIVAIVDYYTQLFLKPIHEAIFFKLKNLPQDRTYTQNPHTKWNYEDGNRFWSLDLSSATDRYPINLQRRLLEKIFGDKVAKSWQELLSSREFLTPEGDLLKYKVGQPMGSYSSWAAFTLTHHMVVHWCAKLCGYDNFSDYIILGDDIVIKNDKVAKMYIKWTNYLGVDISEAKTHVSYDTYEFAKRWICKGVEITGMPMNGIINNINNPFIVMVNLFDYFKVKKNYYASTKDLTSIVFTLYKGLNRKLSVRYCNSRFRMKVKTFHESLNFAFGYSTIDSLRELLVNNIKNESFVVPGNNLIHQTFDDVVSMGLGKSIENCIGDLKAMSDKLIDNSSKLVEDPNDLAFYPIFSGILNHINRFMDTVYKWDLEDTSFIQKSKDLTVLNIDNLFSKERNKTLDLLNVGKIFKMAFNKINETDEIMYGSATVESTWTSVSDLLKLDTFEKNLNLKAFSDINHGKWEKPKTIESMAESTVSAWENW
jgi:hypothetical protein